MAAGARLGARNARPGAVVPGSLPPGDPPAAWPPVGLTDSEKLDLLLNYIGPPRYDLIPGDWTLTELLLSIAGYTEA